MHMSYKIAVASSDGKQIDTSFGAASGFLIYEVADGAYWKLEERVFCEGAAGQGQPTGCGSSVGDGCGSHAGCGGAGGPASGKVQLLADCRCVVCTKIGFPIQKQLERKAICAFDVSCTVKEALEKIAYYFRRMDNHESLRANVP